MINLSGYDELTFKLFKIFQPDAAKRRIDAVNSPQKRFVHYTSAVAASSIIQGKSVWLRNATAMSDVNEINFGMQRLIEFFGKKSTSPIGKKFWETLGLIDGNLPEKIRQGYDALIDNLRLDTYLICISEHNSKEDELGRLSMWRAYASQQGVAIVINPGPLHANSHALASYSYPVIYPRRDELENHFDSLVTGISDNLTIIRSIPRDQLEGWLISMFEAYSICLKHPGFGEELEWRIVYRPKRLASDNMKLKMVEVKGIPQCIYELPLADIPEDNLVGLDPKNLIDRIIIGPTQYPVVQYDYFVKLLADAGVSNPHEKVILSQIPLRT
jgi:Protein of unknown function (DUF2971)